MNVENGLVWELNRPIRMEFNHPVDPRSINFGSVVIRPLSSAIQGRPVTGTFELEPGTNQRVIVFRPTCPTDPQNDNGGLAPGGYQYELTLPTQSHFGGTVLRDTAGRALVLGLTRRFFTPNPPGQPLFLDTVPGPPQFVSVRWPEGLNLFTDPDPLIQIDLNQPIDGSVLNLTTDNLFVLYAAGEIGGAGANDFPEANRVPGQLILGANCTATGATVFFQVSGLLPPNRNLRLVMENGFRDISGETNIARVVWSPDHATPTLAQLYQDPSWNEASETVDEIQESFDTTLHIAGDEALTLPAATVADGAVTASFDFPGQFVSEDADLVVADFLEIFTDGVTIFSDSNSKTFTVQNGVLYVDDFTIVAGKSLRGRGRNPLVIYATGDVRIDGTLDASGNHSHWPTSLNSPQFPEGGALGECGGGQGGDSSQITTAETPRGESGDGPFGLLNAGGGGGEGGFQQEANLGTGADFQAARMCAAGGAGGTFAMTQNVAITWDKWTGVEDPSDFDQVGPDHWASRHPWFNQPPNAQHGDTRVFGGERGLRGSSFEADDFISPGPTSAGPMGVFGMEDETPDTVANDGSDTDPGLNDVAGWKKQYCDPSDDGVYSPGAPNYNGQWTEGDPTSGPDGGQSNRSLFNFEAADPEGSTANDFWGRRVNSDGSILVGELLLPWAGYGGGASGDSQLLRRNVGTLNLPLADVYPDVPFLTNTAYYRKGAPGGGGGGQILIMAIGKITLGAIATGTNEARIKANGGIGHGGESSNYTYYQISGSGGGSGGHIVLNSATALDLSAINVGRANNAGQVPSLTAVEAVRAIGGRRGWANSIMTEAPPGTPGTKDGNGNWMMGRGGAGGNGVIQIQVPDPGTDILWHRDAEPGIREFIRNGDLNGPVDTAKLEQVLDLYGAPRPYNLIPIFSATSQIQSTWLDTGLAYLRAPGAGTGPYPDWAGELLRFQGLTASGDVQRTGTRVTPQDNIAIGSAAQAGFGAFSVTLSGASSAFAPQFLRAPATLIGYDVLPDSAQVNRSFEIVAVDYDRPNDRLTLTTRTTDGAMTFDVGVQWAVREKFFRVATSGLKDALPPSVNVNMVFQGADDPQNAAGIVPGENEWTADLSLLQGKRYVRYRINFDINANGAGVTLNNPRPSVDYLKLPFVW
ncbi:MAG: hypothetical protein EYC70_15875 [Planctomycetota bacterium]|nr:MAG: hypothetical protein EYC70_15875 [Planctomycetota bacterium]